MYCQGTLCSPARGLSLTQGWEVRWPRQTDSLMAGTDGVKTVRALEQVVSVEAESIGNRNRRSWGGASNRCRKWEGQANPSKEAV